MKYQWLRRDNKATKLIVFFSGWGFDAAIVQHLSIDTDTNVLFIDDYRSLQYELPKLEHYQHRSLIAWSFGIASYQVWQSAHNISFERSVAINGSMTPIDRKAGIPPVVMQKTIDTLSSASFRVFAKKCFHPLAVNSPGLFPIDVEARKEELIAIQQRHYPDHEMQWDKVWISRNDSIFPVRNLQCAWHDHLDRVELIDAPHAPFDYWQNWHDLLG